jgi:hypothetical protein
MVKPTVDQLREYAQRIGFEGFDPEEFLAHYESNGWRVGRVPMVSWRATVVTWKKRAAKQPQRKPSKPKLPINLRNERINSLNRRKAFLLRQRQTPEVRRELAHIQAQLYKI